MTNFFSALWEDQQWEQKSSPTSVSHMWTDVSTQEPRYGKLWNYMNSFVYSIRCCLVRTILTSTWNTFRSLHFSSFWLVCMFICFKIHCVVIFTSCTVDSTWNPFNTTIHTDQIGDFVACVHYKLSDLSLLNIFVYMTDSKQKGRVVFQNC